MANIYPSVTTTVSPYSEYNSNIVNRLTRMVTLGTNCIKGTHSCEVNIDTTAPTTCLVVSTGTFFKDDCVHSIDSNFTVDMSEEDFYVDSSAGYWNEAGYYLILADYTYVKSKPAPRVSIKILKPTQHALLTSGYLFLKAVLVSFNGVSFEITSVHDFLPTNPLIRRTYAKTYIDCEDTLPTFDQDRDEGRMVYTRDMEGIFFGQSGRWESVQAIRDEIDTISCNVGQLAYLGTDGAVYPAIATSNLTLASCVVLQVGYRVDGSGQVRLYGVADDVPVEPGIIISTGDQCYLSANTPGTITNLIPANFPQYVGRSITDSTGVDTVTLWFQPGSGTSGGGGSSLYDYYQDLLISSVFLRMTMDAFINQDYIDLVNTTATLDTVNYEVDGNNGEVFVSTNLTDVNPTTGFDGTCITACMLSAQGTVQTVQTWYVTNNGGDAIPDWELVNLEEMHWFSTDYVLLADSTGVFTIGEIVTGGTSGLSGTVVMDYIDHLLIYDITGSGSFTAGETITGSISGSTATIDTGSYKRDSNVDLRVKCEFSGTGTIEDYGVLYEINATIVETVPENSRNIDTLYSDLYTLPSQDNDGLPNLSVPMETCKTNLQIFTGSSSDIDVAPSYNSPDGGQPLIVTQGNSLESATKELDIQAYQAYLDSIYVPLLNSSYMERCSYDGFVDNTQIDLVTSDATYNSTTHAVDGTVGQIFVSDDMYDTDAALTYVDACQVSAEIDLTGAHTNADYIWYVSNDGVNFEVTTINTVHYFSTVELPVDTTGSYTIGEIIVGDTSGSFGTFNGLGTVPGTILLSQVGGSGTFIVGELMNGQTSGATGDVTGAQTDRTGAAYQHLYVMCLFGANGGHINSYGILYDINNTIVTTTPTNTNNISQLAADLYTVPSLDNDGLGNLAVPIETCKDNLQTFVGSSGDSDSAPTYASTTIITQAADLEQTIGELDSSLSLTKNIINITDGDATPTVLNGSGKQAGILITANTGATNITTFDNGISGQEISVLINDNNTTFVNGATLKLQGGTNYLPPQYTIMKFVYIGTVWYETSLSRNLIVEAASIINQDLSTDSVTAQFGILTLGNEGLHILDTNASHDLIIKPGSDLTADRILTITTGDAARSITLNGNPTLNDWFDQSVKAAASPSFAGVTLGNSGLHVLDTNASHDLIIKPGSDLTADRILTLTTGDVARTITLSGNPTLNDWFDQSVKTTSFPQFYGKSVVNNGDAALVITTAHFGKSIRFAPSVSRTATLPTGIAGYDGVRITFIKQSGAGDLVIDAAATDYIEDSTVGGTITTSDTLASITLEYVWVTKVWQIICATASWTTA